MASTENLRHPAGMAGGASHVITDHENVGNEEVNKNGLNTRSKVVCSFTSLTNEVAWSELGKLWDEKVGKTKEYLWLIQRRATETGKTYYWDGPITLGLVSKSIREKMDVIFVVPTAERTIQWMDRCYDNLATFFNEVDPEETGLVRISLPGWTEIEGGCEVISQVQDLRTLSDCVRRSWMSLPRISVKVFTQRLNFRCLVIDTDGCQIEGYDNIATAMAVTMDAIKRWKPKEVSHG